MARLPKSIPGRGAQSQRWGAWRARQRAAVMARCQGQCEALDCPRPAVEAHHVFGRRHIIAEPLASHRVMVAGLCTECHRKATHHPAAPMTTWLQSRAIDRAVEHFGLGDIAVPLDDVGAARAIAQAIEKTGQADELRREAGVS